MCSLCKSIWHGDEECDEDIDIKNFTLESGIIVKKCPKCKVWTEKNLGCNHMTCKICQFDWCWLCLKACPPEHYFLEGSTCFGKQFNEHTVENDVILMRLMTHGIYYISAFFIFYLSAFLVNLIIQNRTILINNANGNNRNRNNNDNNNNNNNNDIEMENNLTHMFLNEEIRQDNIINLNCVQQNNNNAFSVRQKFGLFVLGECILSIIFILLVVTNGFFFIPMITMLGQMSTVTNPHSKMLCFITFTILYILLFIFGFMISCFWFIIFSLNFAYMILSI